MPTDVGSRICTESRPPPPPPPLPYASHDICVAGVRCNTAFIATVRRVRRGRFRHTKLQRTRVKVCAGSGLFAWLAALPTSRCTTMVSERALGSSPRLEGLLYLLFRLASTLLWTVPAACVCCYWIARGVMPVVGIFFPFLVSRLHP